jgi:hypothetical protein
MTENLFTHEGITYRKVNRKANVGEKVLHNDVVREVTYASGDVITFDGRIHKFNVVREVLEPIADSDDLFVTEADVRNNPRQVIDMFTSLALNNTKLAARLTLLEGEHQALGERVERLGDSVEQAVSTVARNVETWAQETETLKHELAKVNERTQPYQQAHELFVKIAGGLPRELTAEERREL